MHSVNVIHSPMARALFRRPRVPLKDLNPVGRVINITNHTAILYTVFTWHLDQSGLKVLYHRRCQYTQANEYHFDGANSIETTNH